MLEIIKLKDRIQSLNVLNNRGPHTSEDDVANAFATLGIGDFRDCGVFLGSFDGNAGWERHLKGDELVQILDGSAEFDIIIDGEKETHSLTGGMITVVPQGCWHRFRSSNGVTVLTATPRHDEEHSHDAQHWQRRQSGCLNADRAAVWQSGAPQARPPKRASKFLIEGLVPGENKTSAPLKTNCRRH